MEPIHSLLVKNIWYTVYDKVLVDGSTKYLCVPKEDSSVVDYTPELIDPTSIEAING